ncbi:helix-turn-helix domain-containing protein [Streptomyces orinoci]|uniref:Helix-turn-helix transcriptional regulator n=1 Tax=Streptomyces orinoci TaxID=67339 RepID=A0ABV3JW72_STRON|nr:helix-turn-helix transcriptional regulator [Streptomyces orinoci]
MAQSDMPTMRSKRLGNELRRLRVANDLKVSQVAELLECGQPKISQIENGKRGIRQIDLTLLLDRYGVTDESYRQGLKQLARDIHKVDWWSSQGPLIHDTLRDYLTLEADSDVIRVYEPALIPGILQTEAYMRELFAARAPAGRLEALVETRLRRKQLLDDPGGFAFRVVVDEPAFHRLMSSRTLKREQLRHLDEVSRHPNVTLQVLPLKAKFPIDQFGAFSLFTFRGESSIDVVWLEHMTGGTLLEQQSDVHAYTRAWEELTAAALSPSSSRRFIGALIEEIGS